MQAPRFLPGLVFVLSIGWMGCAEEGAQKVPLETGDIVHDVGVDSEARLIRIGALNDLSGPAAAIGHPYAVGKRVLVDQINAGGSGLLPEGWRLELLEEDHGYNPQASVQAYNKIQGDVLFIATSLGTPNTLPLRPLLQRDGVVAFPGSLSSKMAEFEFTPPTAAPYTLEAARAMDWVVAEAGAAENVRAGIVYQRDDYGEDGRRGWQQAAEFLGVSIVSEQAIAPTQKDFTVVIKALEDAGASHILLTTLPSATGPILGTAAQFGFFPQWIGNTPAWVDAFFKPEVIPAAVFANYHSVMGLPYWGEPIPGMDAFLAAYEAYGAASSPPDFYLLFSYAQGLVEIEALRIAIESGDVSRAGYRRALRSIREFTAEGLLQPLSFIDLPYQAGTRTRILRPMMAEGTWTEVAPYAEPSAGLAL